MAIQHSSLTFVATNQSLWGPGEAYNLRIDTGNALIYDPDEVTFDIDVGALGFGFSAEAYIDFKIGLLAYAALPNAGHFDASFNIDIDVSYTAAVKTGTGDKIRFDFSDYAIGRADISSEGFNGSPSAGLDLILGLDAGIRNIEYEYWGGGGKSDNFSFFSIDESIALLDLSLNTQLFEVDLTKGLTLKGQLPTGADTEGNSYGSTVVSASGASDTKFIELEADLDELLVELLSKVPGIGAVVKTLGETVFAEHEFDLSDYTTLFPRDAFEVKATLLDIGASAGAVITEDIELDIGNGDVVPDVFITLRSDNGTAGFLGDDFLTEATGWLGETLFLDAPTVGGQGTAKITATYQIRNASFSHDVGIGISASFTISALQASLEGSWVPSFLEFQFGPLLELEFPEGGFNAGLFDFYSDTFRLPNSAFSIAQDTYEVFFTDIAPPGWNPEAVNAQQVINDYRNAIAANELATINAIGDLWSNKPPGSPAQTVVTLKDNDTGSIVQTHHTYIWNGNTDNPDFHFTQTEGDYTFLVVNPNVGTLNRLSVFVDPNAGAIGYDTDSGFKQTTLHALATRPLGNIVFFYGNKGIGTNAGVEVIGNDLGDLLVYAGPGSHYFDGGANINFEYDVFMADFLASHPDVPIVWSLVDAVFSGEGVELANGVNVRNVESLWLITGNANDDIETFTYEDWIETSGGSDFVRNVADTAVDTIRTGAGDDTIVNDVYNASSPFLFEFQDRLSGGTGRDYAVHLQVTEEDTRVDLVDGSNALFGGNGIGYDASVRDLITLSVEYTDFFIDTLSSMVTRDQTREGIVYINETLRQGSTFYDSDIEHISVIAGHFSNDLVLFNGGLQYIGGDGTGTVDTLAGDFHGYEMALGATTGLFLTADIEGKVEGGATSFGTSYIDGFERFSIIASTFDDSLQGGALADFLSGEEGDDYLYGGNDKARDVLLGGAGNDFFYWRNNGGDIILGDTGYYSNGAGDDALLIEASGEETFGLIHAFFDGADLNTAIDNLSTTPIGSVPFFFAYNDATTLLEALDLSRTAVDGGHNHAVAFTPPGGATTYLIYQGVEQVNVISTTAYDDLLIYDGGATYIAGEAIGYNDFDVFAADFSDQLIGITFQIVDDNDTGETLENGVFVQGIDRAIIRAGQGNDELIGGRLDDYFHGGDSTDLIYGSGGNDILVGGRGDDLLYWFGDGNDKISGGAGFDTLTIGGDGEAGIRLFYSGGGDSGKLAVANLDVFAVRQLLDALDTPGDVSSTRNFVGSARADHNGVESVNVFGSDNFDDFVLYQGGLSYTGGSSAGDVFAANFAGISADLYIDVDKRNADGTAAYYDIGNGSYIGGFERIFVRMGNGNDVVRGGADRDEIDGGAGDDYLRSGGGTDILNGGAGNDTISFNNDTVTADGGSGTDTFTADSLSGRVVLRFFDASNNPSPFYSDLSTSRAVLQSLYDTYLPQGVNFRYEAITPIFGQSDFFTIRNFEIVNITGSLEGDFLIGGELRGNLLGLSGDDVLVSRQGQDVMIGGEGDDTYVFDAGMGADLVSGESFQGGTVMFINHQFSDLSFSLEGNDLRIDAIGGSVVISGYFAGGGNGLDLMFSTSDFEGRLDLTGLGAAGGDSTAFGAFRSGTANDDEIASPSEESDLIVGNDGDDLIHGGGGADIIDGSTGEDMVSYADSTGGVSVDLVLSRGFSGDAKGDTLINIEHVIGGQGANALRGNDTNNTLAGLDGDDLIEGRAGNDFIVGAGGKDDLSGDEGDDRIFGDDGADTLSGGKGHDILSGGDNKDTLRGDSGNDTLNGGARDDVLFGGNGSDRMIFGGDDDPRTAGVYEEGFDTFNGGKGTDTADFALFDFAIRVDMKNTLLTVVTRGGFNMDASSGDLRTIAALINVERITGTAFDDILIGDDHDNGLAGGFGNDILVGGYGEDLLYGGAGTDTADYSAELAFFNRIVARVEDDVIIVTDTNGFDDTLDSIENIIGRSGDDVITMNSADNAVDGGLGNDVIDGGDGNDTIVGGKGADTMEGGAGNDTLSYLGARSSMTINLTTNSASGGHAIGDVISGFENVIGGSGPNTLIGSAEANVLIGGADNDRIEGKAGDDTLVGSGGSDRLLGGSGTDTLSYSTSVGGVNVQLSRNVVSGGDAEGDVISGFENAVGGMGNDRLVGTSGSNILAGGAGVDRISGLGGSDIITGGAGADVLNGGGGRDTLSYQGSIAGVVVDLLTEAASGGDAEGDSIASFENLEGGSGHDVLTGSDGANEIFGGAGNDVIMGGKGADTLNGGAGADTLSYASASDAVTINLHANQASGGEADGDIINGFENVIGGRGADNLTGSNSTNFMSGGDGDDVIEGAGGNDRLAGNAGADTLNGGEGADTADYSLSASGVEVRLARGTGLGGDAEGDVLIGIENLIGSSKADTLIGDGAGNILSGLDGKDSLNGQNGDDVISGGGGRDTMSGGGGSDFFVYDSLSDSGATATTRDVITDFNVGGAGQATDRIDLSMIDADGDADGDQAFTFIGSAGFSSGVAGQLRVQTASKNTFVQIDMDGDLAVDMQILIKGSHMLTEDNFVL